MLRLARTALAVLLVAVAAACSSGDDDDDAGGSTDTTEAAADDVTVRAGLTQLLGNELGAVLEVETDPPASVSVAVDGPGGGFEIPATETNAAHRIPVVGMRAESTYTITVTAGEGSQELEWTTGSLPEDLPPVSLEMADAARMEPGLTVFNAFSWNPIPEGQQAPDAGFVLAVDDEGEVVWYQRLRHQILDVDTTPRGTFLVTAGDVGVQEFDLFGDIVRDWGGRVATEFAREDLQGRPLVDEDTVPVDIDSAHHEVTELPNGNIITLSTELLELSPADAARLCPDNPEPSIVGDVIVELSPEGDVVREWKLAELFDPVTYPGAEMCIQGPLLAPPNWFYPQASPTRDWSHANSVELDEEHNALIVSARHFDGVFAVRYEDDDEGPSGEVLWSFGVNGDLELDGEPPYHQHAAEIEGDGTYLVYDNGNFRPGTRVAVPPGDAPPYSRAVVYEVDAEAGTARQVWEHRDEWTDGRPVYTPFLGDVDRMGNGNVLITHGGGSSAVGGMQALITEVAVGDAPDGSADEPVFRLVVGDGAAPPTEGVPSGWSVYRSMRLPSLYFGD